MNASRIFSHASRILGAFLLATCIAKSEDTPAASDKDTLRFISYNLENWLTMDRYIDGKRVDAKPKPEDEKEAIIMLLERYQPDVIGLSEIGTKEDLAELQKRLKAAGVELPHSYHTGGGDPVRHLALLSRLPIVSTQAHEDLDYELEGRTFTMGRGILDVTVGTDLGPVRILGAHLKSKRKIPEADQEMMRRAEAHLLRVQAEKILKENPESLLIVHGDFNDTRNSSAVRTLRGPRNSPDTLNMAYLKDSRGETWTHFWDYQDVYSRFDYVLFSTPLKKLVKWDATKIIDDEEVSQASDHRPLLFVLE